MLLKAEPVALAIESLVGSWELGVDESADREYGVQDSGLRESAVGSWQSAGEEHGASAKQILSHMGESVRDEPVGVDGNSQQSAEEEREGFEPSRRDSNPVSGIWSDTTSGSKAPLSPPPLAPSSPKDEGKSDFAPPGSHSYASSPPPLASKGDLGPKTADSGEILSSLEDFVIVSPLLAEGVARNEPGEQKEIKTAIVITEPSGTKFEQPQAEELASYDQVIFVCGHYEGIDHRVEETFATHVFSIGDYVLTNGELPAMVMADAVVRLLPGVLGNQSSLEEESFQNNLLGAPNYTRPEVWRGKPIPDVLKSGNHAMIDKWRHEQAKERTKVRRPDLIGE